MAIFREHDIRFIPTHVGNTACSPLTWLASAVHPHACGGNTPPSTRRPTQSPVHPHACGEHVLGGVKADWSRGSSPRMWGTHFQIVGAGRLTRFIPTHVGNTCSPLSMPFALPVHPHACGEHFAMSWFSLIMTGSSPRMWGTPWRARCGCSRCRFIPTHVGNTCRQTIIRRAPAVHPHACGEHSASQVPENAPSGSSPRMWGTRRRRP